MLRRRNRRGVIKHLAFLVSPINHRTGRLAAPLRFILRKHKYIHADTQRADCTAQSDDLSHFVRLAWEDDHQVQI